MKQFDLAELIPPKHLYTRYIERDLGGISDVEAIELAVRNKLNVLLMGPTGPGKTSLYLATFAKNEWPLGTGNFNGQTTAEDLVGQIIPVETDMNHIRSLGELAVRAKTDLFRAKAKQEVSADEIIRLQEAVYRTEMALRIQENTQQFEWVNGLLIHLMLGDDSRFEYTGFLADEINFSPAKIMALLNGVTDDRRQIAILQHEGEVIHATDGFHFGAAMNPAYEGTRQLNKAFRDRFHVQLYFDYDAKVEESLIKNPKLRELAKKLRISQANGNLQTPVSTRSLIHFETLERVYGAGSKLPRRVFISHFPEDEQESVRDVAELELGKGTGGNTSPAPPMSTT